MKKVLFATVAAVLLAALTGCGSLRTPAGANKDKVWYQTFFGISIESAVYGDGIIVNQ
ncbi:MAG: hypothetical protein GX946_06270 [Oligosphaeraceae bacterium]|nr:hypothetical protein [Oligosphaeraceae bacterium]